MSVGHWPFLYFPFSAHWVFFSGEIWSCDKCAAFTQLLKMFQMQFLPDGPSDADESNFLTFAPLKIFRWENYLQISLPLEVFCELWLLLANICSPGNTLNQIKKAVVELTTEQGLHGCISYIQKHTGTFWLSHWLWCLLHQQFTRQEYSKALAECSVLPSLRPILLGQTFRVICICGLIGSLSIP